jgi:hypothetical protein
VLRIAENFERSGNNLECGSVYLECKLYTDAVRFFIKCPYTESGANPAITLAIETVKQANQDSLTHKFIDYLTGAQDNIIKAR